MECLKESIKCKLCFQLLEKPVLLPCGNAICEKHQHESQSGIFCTVCDLNHEIPPNGGFIRNLPLENLINQNINLIDFGEEYQSAYEKVNSFSDLLEKFEKLKNDPEFAINAKISELKSEIDLRREELKNQIDEDALSIIKQLDEYDAECKANMASIKAEIEKSNKLNEWKDDLNRWQQQMRTFNKDIDMWKKIYEEARMKYNEMKLNYLNLDDDIFLDRLDDIRVLKSSIGSDRDLIRNHSMTFVVKNVTRNLVEKGIAIESDRFRVFGIDWLIKADISRPYSNKCKYAELSLYAYGKETFEVDFEFIILNRNDPSDNISEDMSGEFDDENQFESSDMIKLNDLISDDDLYDAKNDCFTIQVVINSIKFT